MILHHMAQGTPEWLNARLGIPTSSNFDRIITPAKGDFSKSARSYAFYLAAEAILRQPLENLDHLPWVARGSQMETMAVQHYSFIHDLEASDIRTVGFITNDDATAGCSPDRLLPNNGGLEVKCPSPQVHVGYTIDGPGADYKCQVQGQLYIAELDYVDFWSWHPEMPPLKIRIGRDDAFIAKLEAALTQFTDLRLSVLETLRGKGFFEARPMGDLSNASSEFAPTYTATG